MRIHILPEDIFITAHSGDSLLSLLNRSQIDILLPCAGNGSCGKCQIRFLKGAPSADAVEQVMIPAEKRRQGFRLACRTSVTQDAEIEVPESIRLARFSPAKATSLNTEVAPTGGQTDYAIALDCGTTTLAAALIHRQSGQTLAVKRCSNPQAVFGADLISRIAKAAESAEALQLVRQKLLEGINQLLTELCLECVPNATISRMVCAGNSAMNHFIRNVDPMPLALAPYVPVFTEAKETENEGLFSILPAKTKIVTLPNAGGFVGGDLAADLVTAGFGSVQNYLLLDLGTNCEMALQYKGQLFITSAPAGPALEGASIACGVPAVSGAIDDISLTEQGFLRLHTIDAKPAIGICGSGLFHLIDFLRHYDVVTQTGQMGMPQNNKHLPPEIYSWFKNHLQKNNSVFRLNLTPDGMVYLSQKDIREFQLARAAIRTAWIMLCEQAECSPGDLDAIFIAGAFGTFIRPETLLSLNIIPQLIRSKIRFIGNAALEGARLTLTEPALLKKCIELIKQSQFIEMAGKEEFQETFIEQLNF